MDGPLRNLTLRKQNQIYSLFSYYCSPDSLSHRTLNQSCCRPIKKSDLSIDRTAMTARVSHRSNTDRSEGRNLLHPSIISELPLSQSVSNRQSVKSDLSHPRSPPSTSIVRKLADSCMVWRHSFLRLTSTSTASRSSVPTRSPRQQKKQ